MLLAKILLKERDFFLRKLPNSYKDTSQLLFFFCSLVFCFIRPTMSGIIFNIYEMTASTVSDCMIQSAHCPTSLSIMKENCIFHCK